MVGMSMRDDEQIDVERCRILAQPLAQLVGNRPMAMTRHRIAGVGAVDQDGDFTELAQDTIGIGVGSNVNQVDRNGVANGIGGYGAFRQGHLLEKFYVFTMTY